MQQLQLNNRTLLLVPVPEGSEADTEIANSNGYFVYHPTKPIGTATRHQLPSGNWQLIAVSEALTEEQAAGLVEREYVAVYMEDGSCTGSSCGWVDYSGKTHSCDCALDSFRSFLSVHNITGNHAILQRND